MEVPRIQLNKILFPTNLSGKGHQTFAYAASLARRYNAELTILHIMKSDPELDKKLIGYMPDELWENLRKESLEEARQALIKLQEDNSFLDADIEAKLRNLTKTHEELEEMKKVFEDNRVSSVSHVLLDGPNPAEIIVRYAEENDIDTIIMGVRSRSKVGKLIFGSTAQYVILKAPCPVTTVKFDRTGD